MKVKIKPVPGRKMSPTEAVAAFKRGETFLSESNQPVNRTTIPTGVTVVVLGIEVKHEQV